MSRAPSPSSRATRLITSNLVWDNHACLPLNPRDTRFLPQLRRHKRAGFDVVSLNIGIGGDSIEQHVRMLATFRTWLQQHQDEFLLVTGYEDLERARREDKLAITFDIEGAGAVDDQPSLVRLYYDLGVRWMLIAYNRNNAVGGGCHDNDSGLSVFGRQVLDEMHEVGMVVCCSHTGERTVRDVFEYARAPVIFSHSNSRALKDHPRNICDDLMRLCAASGGVIGINGIGIFLGDNDNSTETYVRHVDHAVQTVGPEHVSLALDYVFDEADLQSYLTANRSMFPPGAGYDRTIRMVEPERLEAIVEGLIAKGYRDQDIARILGDNLMRVARQVWK